jgi:hypothetical protein
MDIRKRTAAVAAGAVLATALGAAASAPAFADACRGNSSGMRCGNVAPTPIYDRAGYRNAQTVDHLRSNPSWFKCWIYGEYTGGGNYIWYYTYGDDHGNWGFVPAVKVYTDTDPAPGLPPCSF